MQSKSLIAFALFAAFVGLARAEERTIQVQFDAPATNYGVQIYEVYEVDGELWVLSRVLKRGDFGGAAITRVKDQIKLDVDADTPVVHKVLGKSWNWGKDTKQLQYVDAKTLKAQLKKAMGKIVWKRKSKAKE